MAVKVATLLPNDAAQFLLERTGLTDRAAARALAETLGSLPLALEQAAAYIEASEETLTGYGDPFRTRRRELWPEENLTADEDPLPVADDVVDFFAEASSTSAATDLLRPVPTLRRTTFRWTCCAMS
ncbi:MAG: hypothetical protein U0Y68_17960 [Blastocatellia bacterium]